MIQTRWNISDDSDTLPYPISQRWVSLWESLLCSLSSHKHFSCIFAHSLCTLFCCPTPRGLFTQCLVSPLVLYLHMFIFYAVKGFLLSTVCNTCPYHCMLNFTNCLVVFFYLQVLRHFLLSDFIPFFLSTP